MKLITLNTWGGKVEKPLAGFLISKGTETDIFCFQEIFSKAPESAVGVFINTDEMNRDIMGDIGQALSGYRGIFCPVDGDTYGIASFIRSGFKVIETGEAVIYENKGFLNDLNPDADHTRKAQWFRLLGQGKKFAIINAHGHWTPTKLDDADRIAQSQRIIELIGRFSCPVILCGDFNLRPDTESIALIEGVGMRNLVREYGVTSTRTPLYEKQEKFADYILVSDGIKVNDFKVLPDVVSDHAPLFLDFEVM